MELQKKENDMQSKVLRGREPIRRDFNHLYSLKSNCKNLFENQARH